MPAGIDNADTSLSARWGTRLSSQIDRWMTSPALYRWALQNPVGRWITRRRADALFELMAGFVHSQVLLACVRLRLLERVLDAPASADELARHTGLDPAALERLLKSAVSLRLLDMRPSGRYGLGALGAPVVTHAGLRAMIEHNALLYADMNDPLKLLQAPREASMHAYWTYAAQADAADSGATARPPALSAEQTAAQAAHYSELMSSSQRFVIEELLASYDFSAHRRVLDVGGGQGGWVTELARHAPHLEPMLFDLPPVAAIARGRFSQQGLGDRISVHGGSFTADALPRGADLVTLLRVAHDHPDDIVRILLKAIYEALPPGGHLLLAEPMAQDAGGRPAVSDPYFHFYLLAMGAGKLRTSHELTALMNEAGFTQIKRLTNPMRLHAGLLLAQKPG